MQTKIRTKIVQPIPMTLPVPTVDPSDGAVGEADDSGAGRDSGPMSSSVDDGGFESNEPDSSRGRA